MNIAIAIPNLHLGGAERVSINLAAEFVARGHSVDLLLQNAVGSLIDSVPEQVRIVDLGTRSLRRSIIPIQQHIRRNKPQAIIANIWPLTLVAGLAAALSREQTAVVTVHQNNLDDQYVQTGRFSARALRYALRLEHRLSTAVIGCSDGVVGSLAKLSGMPVDRFRVQPNPVRINDAIAPAALAEAEGRWRVGRGGRFLAVGNLKTQKNYPLMLEAFSRIAQPDRQLVIIGEGPERESIERMVRELGLAEQIDLPGQSSWIEAYYRTADVFVMSSLYEGLPTVLIEALGAGLTIVSTDCPHGPRQILRGGDFGTLVPMDDAAALAAAMENALSHPLDRDRLIARSADFSPSRVAAAYEALIGSAGRGTNRA